MSDHEANVRDLARVLSEISHTLESSDDQQRRVEWCLQLTRVVVPSPRCALLEVRDEVSSLYVSPSESQAERDSLRAKLFALYRLVAGGDEIRRSSAEKPTLALPVMGLDQIIGVLCVDPDGTAFDARHLRLLSVVAAQLGAYLAMVRLRERDATHSRELESANDFQRLLAGVVGHDLRNQLAVITAVASSLLETTTDADQQHKLERALRNAEHASLLISDLADVTESRVGGVIEVSPQSGDFVEVVETTIDDLQQAHGGRTIEFTPPPKPIVGCFDPFRVAQIVTNLVVNAIVHGEPSLPIRVELYQEDGEVVISVRNWGAPISPALLPTIFDPFKRGAPVARPTHARGLGLGLYIVDSLARGHGGAAMVASDPETGTVFRVRLPADAGRRASQPRARTDRPLVMVVDDDEDIRISMSGILAKRGYEVATAPNGLEALRQLRAGLSPQLILLDYSMPVMNGEEFCEACSRDPKLAAIPVVVVSAATASTLKFAQSQGRGLLTKPVPVDKLLATLESI